MLTLLAPPLRAQTPALRRAERAALEEQLVGFGASGAVVAVVMDSAIAVEAVGHTDARRTRPMEPDLLFGTVDFDDVLTSLVAATLATRGRIDLEQPIRTWAADLPPRVGTVTLAQLLSHTAGLDDAEEEPPRRRPVSRVWPAATDRALFTQPGAIHSPSRYGYPLARAILESATGTSFADLARALVLDPVGMTRTALDPATAERLGAAPGYAVSTTSAQPLVALEPTANPSAQLYATAGDLARLVRLWIVRGPASGDDAVPAAAFRTVGAGRAPRPAQPEDSVGLGVRITRFAGYRQISYAGGYAGYGTLVRILPEAGVGIVMLANATGALPTRVADAILQRALRERGAPVAVAAPPPADTTPAPADPAAFAGTYANGDRIVTLALRDGSLHWVDGDLALPVRRTGSLFEALVADGRVAQAFRWFRDAAGEDYLIVRERAFRRTGGRP
jgi:CubicO group peptidase (beta-lactamase class C family)